MNEKLVWTIDIWNNLEDSITVTSLSSDESLRRDGSSGGSNDSDSIRIFNRGTCGVVIGGSNGCGETRNSGKIETNLHPHSLAHRDSVFLLKEVCSVFAVL